MNPSRSGSGTVPAREVNGALATAILIYLGLSLQLLQVGIIPLLKSIGESLGSSESTVSWLVTGSLLSGAVLLAVLSRVADLIGKKIVVLIALALVLVGSLIGCFVTSIAGLLVARILMGALLPMLALPEAIASDTMSPTRAHQAIGAIHAGTGVGIAGGLILGAVTAGDESSWRSYFVVGVIASAIGLVAVIFGVHDSPVRAPGRLDVLGALLLAAGLVGVLLAITEGPSWHWSSPQVWLSGLLGLVALGAWWMNESKVRHPLISVRHLINPAIRLPYAITFLAAMGIYSALAAVTRLAQTPSATGTGFGWSPQTIAWYAVPQVIGSLLGMAVIRTSVRRDRRVAGLGVGIGFLIVTFLVYGPLVQHGGVTMIATCINAIGLTIVLAMCQIIILRAVPAAESGIAVGLSVVLYAVGNSLGNAITASLFAAHVGSAGVPTFIAYRLSFLVSGVAAVVALAVWFSLARRQRATESALVTA